MTLGKFERLLKKINPKLKIRQRGFGDVGGIFVGLNGKSGYIARLSKGELQLRGFRYELVNPTNPFMNLQGKIKKRGRVTLINLLQNYRWIKNHKQRSMLLWGGENL
jgi:hypothetical protein